MLHAREKKKLTYEAHNEKCLALEPESQGAAHLLPLARVLL